MITVYSKPLCPQCEQAKLHLTRQGVEFNSVDISQDLAAREFVVSRGHRAVPQLYVGEELLVRDVPSLQRMTGEQIIQAVTQLTQEAA